jgi:hypothetical protein
MDNTDQPWTNKNYTWTTFKNHWSTLDSLNQALTMIEPPFMCHGRPRPTWTTLGPPLKTNGHHLITIPSSFSRMTNTTKHQLKSTIIKPFPVRSLSCTTPQTHDWLTFLLTFLPSLSLSYHTHISHTEQLTSKQTLSWAHPSREPIAWLLLLIAKWHAKCALKQRQEIY